MKESHGKGLASHPGWGSGRTTRGSRTRCGRSLAPAGCRHRCDRCPGGGRVPRCPGATPIARASWRYGQVRSRRVGVPTDGTDAARRAPAIRAHHIRCRKRDPPQSPLRRVSLVGRRRTSPEENSTRGGAAHLISLQQEFCYWVVSAVWHILEVVVVMAVRADQSLVCGHRSGGHSDDKGRSARCSKACD